MPHFELQQVARYYAKGTSREVRAVHDFSLILNDGDFLVLIGPSGCGKTTLLRLLAGLEPPDHGRILANGDCLDRVPPQARDVAMVFQGGGLFPHLTAGANLALGLRLAREPKERIRARVQAIAHPLALTQLLDRLPQTLSAGERQRVALGRALIREPALLLLDEPLANLDPTSRRLLREAIRTARQASGMTVLLVTHDQEEALSLGGRLAVMRNGSLEQVGRPPDLYQRPRNTFVASFLGSPPMNLLRGNWTGNPVQYLLPSAHPAWMIWRPPLPSPLPLHRPALLGIRPENLRPERCPTTEDGYAQLDQIEFLGHEQLLHLQLGGQRFIARDTADTQWHPGESVRLGFPGNAVSWFDPDTGMRID